ncbi:MAG: LDCC motif putative metal-binding protein, partial [Spirochaetota bacterium]
FWRRFINNLIESNRKTFGSEPPDCCKLNNKG